MNYQSALEKLGGRDSRKIANNTYLRKAGSGIELILHTTSVVTFYEDGSLRLNSGGHRSKTTQDRIGYADVRVTGAMTSGWTGVTRGDKPWKVITSAGEFPFRDGMLIDADGVTVG